MYFTLILENESGEQVNLSITSNQYMTSFYPLHYAQNFDLQR